MVCIRLYHLIVWCNELLHSNNTVPHWKWQPESRPGASLIILLPFCITSHVKTPYLSTQLRHPLRYRQTCNSFYLHTYKHKLFLLFTIAADVSEHVLAKRSSEPTWHNIPITASVRRVSFMESKWTNWIHVCASHHSFVCDSRRVGQSIVQLHEHVR